MNTEIENAIKALTVKGASAHNQDEALKYTQAALNLAQTRAIMHNIGVGSRAQTV